MGGLGPSSFFVKVLLKSLRGIITNRRFTETFNINTMDFTKVNPILGYEMYSQKDKANMNKRGERIGNYLSEQLNPLIKD